MVGKKIYAATQGLPMVGPETRSNVLFGRPKRGVAIKWIITMFLTAQVAQAGIQIVDFDDASGSGTETVTCVFKQVSAQAGDMIVVAAATNKKGDVSPVSMVKSGGTGIAGAATQQTNGMGTYPTSWGWYMPVNSAGTFNIELTATSITMGGALYVVRADSEEIFLAGSAIWDDTDTADNGSSYPLNYSVETNLTDGVVIEAVSARTDAAMKPAAYTENYTGGTGKRVVASFDGATGTTWSSTYTVSGGDAGKQTSGAIGMVFAEGPGSGSPPGQIAPNNPNLIFQGSEYISTDSTGAFFQRHSDAVLALSTTEKGFNTQKAKTTTGISMLFKTDSAAIDVHFTHDLAETVENRGSRFGVYEDGQFIGSHYFSKTESNLTFTVNSTSPGTASVFRVVFPNWSKPDFRGLEIDSGASLLPYTPPAKKKYVVIGDSISHGTGQTATYETYPWIVSKLLDVDLYNLAVGGSKVSVPIAEMLSDFPPVDLISILIGYNDLHGAGKTVEQYETDLNTMIDTVRSNQPAAQIFCISPTFTTNPTNTTTGEVIQDFRQVVINAVTNRQTAGDNLIYLIHGEDISTEADLNDPVHFSVAGAAHFATNLFTRMDPIVNPPIIPQTTQTNVVLILIDDLGWMDLSVQGSKFYETPRIDELAANGMRFTQGYAAHPRCLPSRYGIMTGRFPGASAVPADAPDLLDEENTIGEAMQAGGYATFFAGKWHISHETSLLPQNQGFDINITGGAPGSPPSYFYPYGNQPSDETDKHGLFLDNTTPVGGMVTDRITGKSYKRTYHAGESGEYITDRLTDEALDWMTWNADKPFFLYMSHYGVHTPFEAPADLVAKYEAKLATMDYGDQPEYINVGVGQQKMRQNNPTYAAMIESVDTNVGRLLDKIDELGIASNTVVIFTADNGGLSNRGGYNNRELATSNYPLRTGKGWLYEGGIREAFIVKGPGIPARVNTNAVINGTDIYPTILELTGQPLRPLDHRNGVSFKTALTGAAYNRGEPILWHSPLARPYSTGDFNSTALRDGDYKLIWWYDTPGRDGEFHYELYNVATDPGETQDLSRSMPDKAADLLAQIKAWYNHEHWERSVGVIKRPDNNDVSMPPQAWLDDSTVPTNIQAGVLSWGNYAGFTYNLWSRTNLLSGSWTPEAEGLTTNQIPVPMDAPQKFYKVESVLDAEE